MESTEGKRSRKEKEHMTKAAYHSRYRRFCFSTQDILKTRSRPRLEPGSDYHYLVRITGLEPALLYLISTVNTRFYFFHDKFHDEFLKELVNYCLEKYKIERAHIRPFNTSFPMF